MTAQIIPGLAVLMCVVVAVPLTTAEIYVPAIPESQKDSALFHLWKYAIKQQGHVAKSIKDKHVPNTFLTPTAGEVMNWAPQDSVHPLYIRENIDLLREILLDYMINDVVRPDDSRMNKPSGLYVMNRNGKTITFKRLVSGEITANGVKVVQSSANNDGTYSYILDRSLFRHREKVQEAWEKYIQTVPVYEPFGRPISGPHV